MAILLGTLGEERAPFGQGSLVRFRVQMIANDLDKKLVDRKLLRGADARLWFEDVVVLAGLVACGT